jgi:hypothetical protein
MAKGRSNKGASLAQSGGRDTSFGGGKGGNAYGKQATRAAVRGSGKMNTGSSYQIRNAGGNNTLVPSGDKRNAAPPPPVHPGDSKQVTGIRRPKQLPPVLRGSTYALKGKYK